ncbi:DUF6916 family protein [Photobacterium rosenbergii]|uniref:DUF6916 domain-containing protein n=1 Tax=Photobacterium rosenbergii TaxID=294936 RepID=A0ABU3ZCR8_9GAMM|nr:hypothetical protein [Photobacterium rosenbergii]MDV5167909.1 hypothetical protein [Photobacterium rosenbergii]
MSKNPMSMENVQKLVGEQVKVFDQSGHEAEFTVSQVTQQPRHGFDDLGRFIEHFVITFQGDGSTHFPDGHYHFKHPKLGEVELHVIHKHDHDYEVLVETELVIGQFS